MKILGMVILMVGISGCVDLDDIREAASLSCQVGYYQALLDTNAKLVKSEKEVVDMCDKKAKLIEWE